MHTQQVRLQIIIYIASCSCTCVCVRVWMYRHSSHYKDSKALNLRLKRDFSPRHVENCLLATLSRASGELIFIQIISLYFIQRHVTWSYRSLFCVKSLDESSRKGPVLTMYEGMQFNVNYVILNSLFNCTVRSQLYNLTSLLNSCSQTTKNEQNCIYSKKSRPMVA